jgi:phage FluMu gp28-like protein
MTIKQQTDLFTALAQEVNIKCAADGLFWTKFVSTRDEADPEHSVKPFPLHEEYVKTLWQDWAANQVSVVAKSRQMFVSWEICTFAVHWARYRPNQAVYFQTQNWPDAVAMVSRPEGYVEGRMQFIETHLPAFLKQKAKFTEGMIQYPNGSIIQALSGGANQIRSKTPSLYIGDEFAFQEDQDKIWTSVAPLIQKGARAILISTPNGSNNQFATLYHGHPVGESVAA